MKDACVIKATFSNWRPVNGRKVLQLVFEVPIEQTKEVLTMLDAPADQWCAIALLNPQGGASTAASAPQPRADNAGTSPKPRRAFKDLSLAEQAGIRCEDGEFRQFLCRHDVRFVDLSPDSVAEYVRWYCGVASRSELATNHEAANKWRKLNSEFEAWYLDKKYAETLR